MEIRNNRRAFPFLLIAGLAFILFGLGSAYIASAFTVWALACSALGLLCVFASLGFILNKIRNNISPKGIQRITAVILGIILLIAILAGINILGIKYNKRFDLTKAKQHTLHPATVSIIQNLKKDVKITVFYVGVTPKYIEDLLSEYKRFGSPHMTTEIINPLEQIGYAAQFQDMITTNEKTAIVQSGKEKKEIDFTKDPLAEEDLTNAVVKVTREKRKVYFLAGHGEYDIDSTEKDGFSKLKSYLQNVNAEVKKLLLGKEKSVPGDCDVLIIGGPKNPLPEKEESAINEYLTKGGNVLFLIESTPIGTPEQPLSESDKAKNPALNNILNKWGVKVNDDLAVDMENYVGGDVGCPATKNYPPHKVIVHGLDYTFYIRPRSVTLLTDHPKDIKAAPLVWTASKKNSWAEKDKSLHIKFDELLDAPGPVTLAAIVWQPKDQNKAKDTKIIVFTDADFASNNFINEYSNADMILNSVSWLSELENIVSYENKSVQIEKISLTSKQLRVITVVLIGIPLIIALAGGLTWWQSVNPEGKP